MHETVRQIASANLPTPWGEFQILDFERELRQGASLRLETATSPFADIESAADEMRAGHMVIIVDDEERENEGDLTNRDMRGAGSLLDLELLCFS